MGNTSYSVEARMTRSSAASYGDHTKPVSHVFEQNRPEEMRCHKEMHPHQIRVRESRDSEAHPLAYPVIIALDVTASMSLIPRNLISDGLPKIIENLHEQGIKDVALMFMPFGDHECDDAPLQISQFESGDAELDLWLTRTYIEGGGGGNKGESYFLPWLVAAHMCQTDHWDKRQSKGTLITIGDEPNLKNLSTVYLHEVLGEGYADAFPALAQGTNAATLLEEAQEKWDVHHLHCTDGSHGDRPLKQWQEDLGADHVHATTLNGIVGEISTLIIDAALPFYDGSRESVGSEGATVVETAEETTSAAPVKML